MDSLVEAAWIGAITGGVGIIGTATVAITAARTTRRITDRANQAATANIVLALDAARSDRLWEKRAEAYVDALRLLHRRQALREEAIRTVRFDRQGEERIRQWLNSFKMPDDWQGIEMRMLAYASTPVFDAVRESAQANDAIDTARQRWEEAREQVSAAASAEQAASNIRVAFDAIKSAIMDANAKDEVLLAVIRADLHDRPSTALIPADTLPGIAKTWRRMTTRRPNLGKRAANGARKPGTSVAGRTT